MVYFLKQYFLYVFHELNLNFMTGINNKVSLQDTAFSTSSRNVLVLLVPVFRLLLKIPAYLLE